MSDLPVVVRRALISVADKSGVTAFASVLIKAGVEILSTGGTARHLTEAGIAVTDVSAYTGFPEIMGGRVKTLHPKVHGGILGRRGSDEHVMAEHAIAAIDLVAVNLYPFQATTANDDCSFEEAIENIDIGGPAMVRAAAKNHIAVTILVDPEDYTAVADEIIGSGVCAATRRGLAAKAFAHTAQYDGAISDYLTGRRDAALPSTFNLTYGRRQDLRYGENPHQQAAFYRDERPPPGTLATATLVQGKALSYNNIVDADTAIACLREFAETPACVIVKHANPCGVGLGDSLAQAYDRAFATDPTAAFGGIVACNRPLDGATAKAILERQFVEVVIAPMIDDGGREALRAKANVRVLEIGSEHGVSDIDCKSVSGGLLVQTADTAVLRPEDLRIVSKRRPQAAELRDMMFAWRVAKYAKSNAIVYAKHGQTIGIGAGQMSRVMSVRVATTKAADAALDVTGAAMASDAFFPFRDGVDVAAEAGVRAVIQPGGSRRDAEVIAAADEHDMAMAFTGMRHFRH